jgi:uncharacterized membrane protein
MRGQRYTYQWASLLILLYLAEGIVRATTDAGDSVSLAWTEFILAFAFFTAVVGYARLTRTPGTPTWRRGAATVVDSTAHCPDTGDSRH